MRSNVKRRGQQRHREWTSSFRDRGLRRMGWLLPLLLAIAVAGGAWAEEGEVADVPTAVCTLDGLRLTTSAGEQRIPLPGRCVAAHGDRSLTLVAGGADGAWVVHHSEGEVPWVVAIPTTGAVIDVRLRDGYAMLTEQVDQVRLVDLEQLARAAEARVATAPGETEGTDGADAVVEPHMIRIGTVFAVRGPRVFVGGDGVSDGPVVGDWISVVRRAVPRDLDPTSGRVLVRGQPGYESVIRVVGNDGTQLVAEVGRGDQARIGDEVYAGGALEPTERLTDPRPARPLAQVGIELVPAVSLSDPGVVGLGRAWVSYSFGFPMRVELALRQGVVALPRNGDPVAGGAAEVLASLDLPAFEIGLTAGYQRFENPGGGVLLGHYLRFGYRDGFLIEVRTRFLLPPADFFGGVEGRIVIPMDRLASMTLEGGGGSSVGFALIGVQIHAIGQGGRGSLLLNPGVGFVLNQWEERSGYDHRSTQLAGPAIAMRVEYRP